jgi:ElaA protein
MIKFYTKKFDNLSTNELYQILYLRSEVFVVEQNSIYQDIDNKDQKAIHILGYKNQKLIAYARIFKPNDYFKLASIGRVVIVKEQRDFKYGYNLMEVAIKAISEYFNEKTIVISAQEHLENFYSKLGFKRKGNTYLEDGIPHIKMFKKNE